MVCHDGIGRESERFELKGESFRKVLTLPMILKINNGLNGYAPKLVNGYRPEYVDHRNLDGIYTDFFKVTQKSQKFLSTDHTENTAKIIVVIFIKIYTIGYFCRDSA